MLLENATLSPLAQDNGYRILTYNPTEKANEEYYVMSGDVNEYLQNQGDEIRLKKITTFSLSDELEMCMLHVMHNKINSTKRIFDGKLAGLVDDICVDTKNIRVVKFVILIHFAPMNWFIQLFMVVAI